MKHRGEILKLRIEQSGIAKTVICKSLGISDNTLANWHINPELGYEKLLMVGEIIAYDFSQDFPLLKYMKYDKKVEAIIVSEPVEAYKKATSEAIEVLNKRIDDLQKDQKIMLQLLDEIITKLP